MILNLITRSSSLLGGLLFTIYINDLYQVKLKSKIVTYADNTAINYSNENSSIQNEISKDMFEIYK